MSTVLMTRNRFANNSELVHIRSCKTFVDSVAANPRLTFLTAGAGVGDGDGVDAGVAGDVCAGEGADGCTSAASNATRAPLALSPGTPVLAHLTRTFVPAGMGARATVGAASVSGGVVFGSLVFLVMSQAP